MCGCSQTSYKRDECTGPDIETQQLMENMENRDVDQLLKANSGQVGAGQPSRALLPFSPKQTGQIPCRYVIRWTIVSLVRHPAWDVPASL